MNKLTKKVQGYKKKAEKTVRQQNRQQLSKFVKEGLKDNFDKFEGKAQRKPENAYWNL